MLEVLERRYLAALFVDPALMPARTRRHEEGVTVGGLVVEQFLQQLGLVFQVREGSLAQHIALAVEFVGQPLEE